MKLSDFIEELQKIAKKSGDPNAVDVRMADYLPVMRPKYKEGDVFITDQE